MRHTALGYKNPAERSAEFRYPTSTRKGGELFSANRTHSRSGSRGNSFGREKRFLDYTSAFAPSGVETFIGPGTYNPLE